MPDRDRKATVGQVLAPGLDEDSLERAQDRLTSLEDDWIDFLGGNSQEVPDWLTTARIVLRNAQMHYDLNLEGYRDG